MPDSMLEAAKKVAQAIDLPWPRALKVYHALQHGDPQILPVSTGRKIVAAYPNLIAEFLVGLCRHDDADAAPAFVQTFVHCERKTGPGTVSHFLWELGRLLRSRENAAAVEAIELHADTGTASILFKEGASRPRLNFASAQKPVDTSPIRDRGKILDGAVLARIAETVEWVPNDNKPWQVTALEREDQ